MEEFTPDIDSSEWWWNSSEATKEVSEKFKEGVKKWSAGIKRTSKDEWKAKKHDLLLANFLVKIIINKKYDTILDSLFKALDSEYPSNFLLGILSLINLEISNKIRELSEKEKVFFTYKSEERLNFDDNNLDKNIKNRINFWVEDITDIVTIEYSSLLTQKLIENFKKNDTLLELISKVFKFFLDEININISNEKCLWISEFILGEIEKQIKTLNIEQI